MMQLNSIMRSGALIADDDEFFRVALHAILRDKLAFPVVVESESLDAAIEILSARGDLTLVLLDLAMPGMRSPDGLRAVREHFPDIRVSVVSASNNRQDILMALDAGVHGYVPKALGVVELGRALQAICEGMIYVPAVVADVGAGSEDILFGAARTGFRGIEVLSVRQRDVLSLLVDGKSNKEMARALDLSPGTIKFHLAALFRHLGVGNRVEAAAAGARLLAEHE